MEHTRGWLSRGTRLACGAALVALVGCGDSAERPPAPEPVPGGAGRILYLTHCESCHGSEGRGDGPVASALRVPPTDLTGLWERYGTPLDREQVAQYIDGRRLVGAHGREMPIWGEAFFDDLPQATPNVEGVKRRLIDVLVAYLDKIQARREL